MNMTAGPMHRIAALQGAPNEMNQRLLADFAERLTRAGVRVAGVVEVARGEAGVACGSRALRDLSSGAIVSISQNLGRGSGGCNLDAAGLAEACAAVERAIADGADLVVLSKFGKQEAARGGLADAFRAAISAGLPIATAVSPALGAEWRAFAGPLSGFVEVDAGALDAWWLALSYDILAPAAE